MYVELLVENIIYREEENNNKSNSSDGVAVTAQDKGVLTDFVNTPLSGITEKTIEKLTKYFAKKYAPSTNVKDKDALLKMSKDSILEILKDAVLQDIKAHANSADTKVELTGKDNKKAKAKGVDILAYIYNVNFVGEEEVKKTQLYKKLHTLFTTTYKVESPDKKALEFTQTVSRIITGKISLKELIIWIALLVFSLGLIVFGLIKKGTYDSGSSFIEKAKAVYDTVTTTAFDIWTVIIIIGFIGLAVAIYNISGIIWRKITHYYEKVTAWLKEKFSKDKK